MGEKMKKKTRYFNHLVNYMQRRMRDKCVTIDAKIEVVRIGIDQLIGKWKTRSIMYKDEGMKRLLEEFKYIDPKVLDFLLKSYIRQCKKKHALAFLEWRIHFSKSR
jgi:hypothetical protein